MLFSILQPKKSQTDHSQALAVTSGIFKGHLGRVENTKAVSIYLFMLTRISSL